MGVLPFLHEAELQAKGGDVIAEKVPCSIWPTGRRRSESAGAVYDHEGEAHLDHADALQEPNRFLILNGKRYTVVTATPQPYVPHVELELREVKAGG